MTEFEYAVETAPADASAVAREHLETVLDSMARSGWRYVGDHGSYLIFEREIEE